MDPDHHHSQHPLFISIHLTVSFLSFVGSLFMILVHFLLKRTQNFALYLIFWISVSDFILSIGRLLSFLSFFDSSIFENICQFQAILVNFGTISSVLSIFCVSWMLYTTVVHGTTDHYARKSKYLLFSLGIPALLTIIAYCIGSFNEVHEGFCWIEVEPDRTKSIPIAILGFLEFVLPIWLTIGFVLRAMIVVRRNLSKSITAAQDEFIKRIQSFAFILMFCWGFPTVYMLVEIFQNTGEEYEMIHVLNTFLIGLQGFFISFVFGTSGLVKSTIRGSIRKWCKCFKSEADDTVQTDPDIELSRKSTEELSERTFSSAGTKTQEIIMPDSMVHHVIESL